jgi:hypothetical protein
MLVYTRQHINLLLFECSNFGWFIDLKLNNSSKLYDSVHLKCWPSKVFNPFIQVVP